MDNKKTQARPPEYGGAIGSALMVVGLTRDEWTNVAFAMRCCADESLVLSFLKGIADKIESQMPAE